jgi:hypothetical protein
MFPIVSRSKQKDRFRLHALKTDRLIKTAIVCVFSFSAVISVGNVVARSYSNGRFDNSRWGKDLYQFWHGGRLFLRGVNPYMGMKNYPPPTDTPEASEYPRAARGLTPPESWHVRIVSAAPPLFLLMLPLSVLPWVPAGLAWFLLNVGFAALFVRLVLKCAGRTLFSLDGWLLASLFFSLICTRQVFELGQNSLAVAALMYLSLAAVVRSQALSGILLGIAFSKFSVALPMVFYFAYKKKVRPLLWCGLTQVLGLLVICVFAPADWMDLARRTLWIARLAFNFQPRAFPHGMMPWDAVSFAVQWTATAATMLVAFQACRRRFPERLEKPAALTLLSVFSLWSLLALFHNRHDMVIALPFLAISFLLYDARDPGSGNHYFSLAERERLPIQAACALILFVWIFPVYAVTGMDLYRRLYQGCTVAAFAISLRFFYCLQRGMGGRAA